MSDIALLPGTTHTLKLNRFSGREIENIIDEEQINIALPLKQNFGQSQLKEEDFYRIGASFQIASMEKTKKGYKIKIKVLDRVEIKEIEIYDDSIRVNFEFAPDNIDISEKSQEEMVEYIKKSYS